MYNIKKKIKEFKIGKVVRCFFQKHDEDYNEIFCHVAKMTFVLVIISLTTSKGWKL